MSTSYTPNYKLDLYTDTDKPNLRDQYNGAITKIDAKLFEVNGLASQAINGTNDMHDTVNKAVIDIAANTSRIGIAENSIEAVSADYKTADAKIITDYSAADATITNGYKDADNDIIVDYKAKDTQIINDYKAADAAINNQINNVVTPLANKFPIRSDDIAAGAVTRDKLDAQALASLMRGMTIRHFNNRDNTADNEGLSIPSGGSIEGYYIPELTLLTVTYLEVTGTFANIILPSYVPRPMVTLDSGKVRFGIGIIWDNTSGFKNWYYIYYTREGFLYGPTVASNEKVSLAGSAICYLRAYGAE